MSAREYAKWGHRWLRTSLPISFIALLKIEVTNGIHPPQPVPAFVHDLTSPRDLQDPSLTTPVTSPLTTLWQEHICVSSVKSSPSSSPSFAAPMMNCDGGTSRAFLFFTIGTSLT